MSDPIDKIKPYQDKISSLSSEDVGRALDTFHRKIDYAAAANLNSCVHCGLCADSCHYYLSDGETESLPAHKLNLISSVFKKHFTPSGKTIPAIVGAKKLDREMIGRWVDSLFGRCTLCGRCALNCSVGINITRLIRIARTALVSVDLVPAELQATVNMAKNTGNNMGIPGPEWVETVQWLEEELRQETQDPKASFPIDRKGADVLYTVNPREPKFFPLSLLATAKVFYAAKENWTVSSSFFDVTNYGLFSGDDDTAGLLSSRLLQAAQLLGVKTLVLGECGHGFNANRWEAPQWLAQEYGIEVKSILEVIADYIRDGRLRFDRSRIGRLVTLHDPCNLVRLGGISEEQRFILKSCVADFVEMHPNREKNFCCGGGGGQLSMTGYAARRIRAGRIKADQIKKTGAKVVVAPCHNCIDQLSELNKEYQLGVDIRTVSEMVAESLIIENKLPAGRD